MLQLSVQQNTPIPLAAELSVGPREIVAMVGPSGAGKTTLLRSIAGLYRPATARITINNEIWHDSAAGIALPPHRRRAGLVFQGFALFPHLDALTNVMIAMAVQDRAAALALLDDMGLAGLHARHPADLSGGQQQRVALARALARDPAVLLLDEPFAAIDRPVRRDLLRLLARLHAATPRPTIIVTHDIEDAARIADRLCFVEAGTTVETGTPDALLGNPHSRLRLWLDG